MEKHCFYIDSKKCVCPFYKNELIKHCKYVIQNNIRFGVVIDEEDHDKNGVIVITTSNELELILNGYTNLYSKLICECLMCNVSRLLRLNK